MIDCHRDADCAGLRQPQVRFLFRAAWSSSHLCSASRLVQSVGVARIPVSP